MAVSDSQLLDAFAQARDQAAFAELVRRRIDFVYACALRQVGGDAHRAADLTQDVFIAVARKAAVLSRHPTLLGWLCTATRFAAVDLIRSEQARKAREQAVSDMHLPSDQCQVDWTQIQPVLDSALAELPDPDRHAVLARFFDHQSFAAIAHDFGVTENAAQKRVDRALDKLRVALSRRRITSTTAALGLVLSSQPLVSAPLGLAAAVTQSAAIAAGISTGAAGLGLVFLLMKKYALGLMGTAAAIGVGTVLVAVRAEDDGRQALAASQKVHATLARELHELEQRAESGAKRIRVADQANAALLQHVQNRSTASSAPLGGITETFTAEMARQRFQLAQKLVVSGDPQSALRELIWCYDIGLPRTAGLNSPSHLTSLMTFARLGERYPPALEALRERRDKAWQTVQADTANRGSLREYAAANRALKNEAESVAFLDTLEPGDQRRRILASACYEYLAQAQRYREAAEGTSISLITSGFERVVNTSSSLNSPTSEPTSREFRAYVLERAANDIEMLAGSGATAEARAHAARLFAFDNTESTRALIQQRLARAGQPNLLQTPTAP
jgi:RNA polymerase sigma factor (sigma-70 family)